MKTFLCLALLPFLCAASPAADHGAHGAHGAHGGYGGYAPKLYCRDTNTSIYAEVCVPSVATETKQVELDVKTVEDDTFCYTSTQSKCEEVTRTVENEVCTYEYSSKKESMPATTTQVTYEEKSETMKVTTCRPSGYGQPKHGYGAKGGEHQYCREEYQTQEYRVPLVDAPLEVSVDVSAPEPQRVCQVIKMEITETVCNDVQEERCIDLAKLEEGTTSVEQTEAIIGEPNCNQLTLTLPTEACSKQTHGYHH